MIQKKRNSADKGKGTRLIKVHDAKVTAGHERELTQGDFSIITSA